MEYLDHYQAFFSLKIVDTHAQLNIDEMTPLCDDNTPLGLPVEPDV